MLYLIDGYNITKSDPVTRRLPLEEQREALLARLSVSGDRLLGRGKKVVVFDGTYGWSETVSQADVEVRFSRDESADDLIVRLAAASEDEVCLVTSDRLLVERVGRVAEGHMQHKERDSLFESAKKSARRGRRNRSSGIPRETGIPKGGNLITKEMKEIWLSGEDE